MWLLDDWHDWIRFVNLVISTTCIFLLAQRFRIQNRSWNTKTRDYWYALTMWCVAGVAISIEGVVRDSPAGARLIFILMASAVTYKGLMHKGSWGSSAS